MIEVLLIGGGLWLLLSVLLALALGRTFFAGASRASREEEREELDRDRQARLDELEVRRLPGRAA